VAAEVIESFGAGQSTGQPAGDGASGTFVGDVPGMPLEQFARRKLPTRQVFLIKHVNGVHQALQLRTAARSEGNGGRHIRARSTNFEPTK
jgi:hypothetical protein